MSHLRRLWLGMLTENNTHSGTNSQIVLIVNQNGIDKLHQTLSDTPQNGEANLYEFLVSTKNIEVDSLNNSSVRIGIRGPDLWQPAHILVWGQRFIDGAIQPIAIETSLGNISTQHGEGRISDPIRRVGLGSPNMEIRRLLLLIATADMTNAGTNSTVELLVNTAQGGFIAEFEFPSSPQAGQANWYFAPVPAFRKNDLGDDSIRLRILGDNAWLPASFFLFGLDDAEGRPEFLVPLVNTFSWPHGWMSTDPSEGDSIVTLEQV